MQISLPAENKTNSVYTLLSRFFITYFIIFVLPFPTAYIPFTYFIYKGYNTFFDILASWAGKYIFHFPFVIIPDNNGSSDTTYKFLKLFAVLIIVGIITIVWCIADKKKKNDTLILQWVMSYVRFYFALTMVRYGMEKVIKGQFPFPYNSLDETYGESSPTALMWNFMGYSTVYNLFIGAAEVLAGCLILFKKTTMTGALISIIILSNVVILNLCYDVPVKLFALNFLAMALFIVSPYTKRLQSFFLSNTAIPEMSFKNRFTDRRSYILWYGTKCILIFFVIYGIIEVTRNKYYGSGDGTFIMTPLFGIYRTEKFIKNGDILVPLLTDTLQWKTLSLIHRNKATVRFMDDTVKAYSFIVNTKNKHILISDLKDTAYKGSFDFSITDSSHLLLKGRLRNDSISILLKKQDLKQYELIKSKFRWIQETAHER